MSKKSLVLMMALGSDADDDEAQMMPLMIPMKMTRAMHLILPSKDDAECPRLMI